MTDDFSGIWDCLASQQVVDAIRYEVSEGKELAEITELICDHCLAPDAYSRPPVGCDNMTIIIIALLHGRTEEEWCSWIKNRVENSIGYAPNPLPQLYSSYRMECFRERLEEYEQVGRPFDRYAPTEDRTEEVSDGHLLSDAEEKKSRDKIDGFKHDDEPYSPVAKIDPELV